MEKKKDSMKSIDHSSLLHVENLTYYRDDFKEHPCHKSAVLILTYMPNSHKINCKF